jgi:dTDP-4-amino-4,6-dideoxygalactose transaminase
VADVYCAEIRNPLLRLPIRVAESRDAWHLFAVRVPPGRRDEFERHLARRGVESGRHYPRLIPEQGAMREARFEVDGDLPRARDFAASQVSLPVHPQLRDDEVKRVVDACNEWV